VTEIRPATEADLPGVAAIYDEEVRTGTATFDVEPPGLDLWRSKLASDEPGDHFLVAVDAARISGYAYSASYRTRPAYRHTRETSVYLARDAGGQGLGRRLYDELLGLLRGSEVHTVLAGIALPNPASEALHASCGFERLGVMHEVGFKFSRWIDVAWWELRLG